MKTKCPNQSLEQVHKTIKTCDKQPPEDTKRQGPDFHFPSNKLVNVQKGVYYSGIKIFNNLPYGIKNLSSDVIKFKLALKRFFLLVHFIPEMSITIGTLGVILVLII
jgi:hypothetical protein